jgi:hypothetical protein
MTASYFYDLQYYVKWGHRPDVWTLDGSRKPRVLLGSLHGDHASLHYRPQSGLRQGVFSSPRRNCRRPMRGEESSEVFRLSDDPSCIPRGSRLGRDSPSRLFLYTYICETVISTQTTAGHCGQSTAGEGECFEQGRRDGGFRLA